AASCRRRSTSRAAIRTAISTTCPTRPASIRCGRPSRPASASADRMPLSSCDAFPNPPPFACQLLPTRYTAPLRVTVECPRNAAHEVEAAAPEQERVYGTIKTILVVGCTCRLDPPGRWEGRRHQPGDERADRASAGRRPDPA